MRWLGSTWTPITHLLYVSHSSFSHSSKFTVTFDKTAVRNDLYVRYKPTCDRKVLVLTSVSSEYPKINFYRSALPLKVYGVIIPNII